MFINSYQKHFRVIGISGLFHFEEGRPKRRPTIDNLQKCNFSILRTHTSILIVGSHNAAFPVVGALNLYQIGRYHFPQHLPEEKPEVLDRYQKFGVGNVLRYCLKLLFALPKPDPVNQGGQFGGLLFGTLVVPSY